MSPSESQLRAALREGEGGGLDTGRLIAHARRVQRERRRRRTQLVAATVVVGAVVTGFSLLAGSGPGEEAASSAGGRLATTRAEGAGGAGSGAPHKRAAAHPGVPSPAASGGYGAATTSCPQIPDLIALPQGVTQDEASGPLLPTDPAAIRACAYPSGQRARTLVLRSTAASALASTINAASYSPGRALRSCTKDERVGTVELLAVDAGGRRTKPVVVTVACPEAVATNGSATRYFTVAPRLLSNLLR